MVSGEESGPVSFRQSWSCSWWRCEMSPSLSCSPSCSSDRQKWAAPSLSHQSTQLAWSQLLEEEGGGCLWCWGEGLRSPSWSGRREGGSPRPGSWCGCREWVERLVLSSRERDGVLWHRIATHCPCWASLTSADVCILCEREKEVNTVQKAYRDS